MLLLDNKDVLQVLTMRDCLAALERVYAEIITGDAVGMGRMDLYTPSRGGDAPFHRWAVMPGTSAGDGYMCARILSDMVSWPTVAGKRREDKYAVQPGTWCGFVFLHSTKTGEPLAFMHDGVLQHYRVGAGAGLAAKHLSRTDSRAVGMIGSGGMARTYLQAFVEVRPVASVKVYSPNEGNRRAYAEEMSDRLGLEVQAVDSARQAVRDTDIVALCASAVEPVFFKEWLEPGMHVVDVTRPSTEPGFSAAADVAFWHGNQTPILERLPSSALYARGGYLSWAAGQDKEKEIIPRVPPDPDLLALPTLADLIAGRAEGRTSSEQTSFFSNIGELGTQFVAVSALVYEKAREAGLGRELPTEWFLEDVRA